MLSKTPLRLVLIVPFVAQITAAVGLTAWLSIRNGQKAVDDIANNLWADIIARTEQHITEYTKIPQEVILDTLANHNLNLANLRDQDTLTRYLWHQMRSHQGLFITAVGYETGEVVGVGVEENGQLVVRAIAPGQTKLHTYAVSGQGNRGGLISADDFDLKSRPWYRDAVEAKTLTWTDIYLNYAQPFNILSAVSPIYDVQTKELIGVTNATLSLWQINHFLEGLEVGQSGEIFIIERTGDLVASSTGESLHQIDQVGDIETSKRLNALESRNARVQQTAEHLMEEFDNLNQIQQVERTQFFANGEREIVQITPFADDLGLDWLIVTVVPESDFMAQIYANTRNTIWLCLGALALATGSSILFARWITQPLLRLNQAAKDITQDSLQSAQLPGAIATNRTREVSELSHSFHQMTQQLQASFAAIQESEANFRNMATNVPGAIFRYILRPDGTDAVLYMSPGCYQLWEIEAHQVEQNASLLWEVVHPEDLPAMQASVMESAQTLETWNWEWRITTPSGCCKWLQATGQPTRQIDGSVLWHSVILDVSDRKRAEAQSQDLTNRLELAVRSAEMGIWEWDIVRDRVIWDDRMYELYGLTPEEFREAYQAWERGVHPDDQIAARTAIQQALSDERDFDTDFRVLWPDGNIRHIEAHAVIQRDAKGHPRRMIGVNWDITKRKQAESERTRLLDVLEASLNEIYLFNSETLKFEYANQGALQNLRYPLQQLQQMTPLDVKPELSAADFEGLLAPLRQGTTPKINFETVHQRADGSRYPVDVYLQLTRHNGQSVFLAIILDISDRKRAEDQLIYSALHDALTDLPNRTLLTSRLELAVQRSQRSRTYHFAILFLDLDQFKVINDSLGHLVGDELLITLARKLKNLIRPTDLAARLGGDEFVILLEHIPDIQAVIHLAERLLAEFESATIINGYNVFITTSIGIVWGTQDYTDATDLLRDADIALYRAKAKGRSRYEIFDVEMHVQAVKRMRLEHDLRIAIAQQEFVTYYQPIVDLNTQRLIGFEALIRWQHPARGFVSPADFIPVAEETGLILPISQWVLRSACKQVATWRRQFPEMEDLRMSVNLSGQDLRQPHLVETILQTLEQVQLPATSLTLEITESMLIEDIETSIDLLRELRSLGVRISIDDFGTGYSSLSYLYNLPADYLKIDQSFVSNMQPGDKNYKIVQAVVSLSDQLQIAAIAEGIETEQQMAWLKDLGCELGQGYLLARPLAAEAATELLAVGHLLQP